MTVALWDRGVLWGLSLFAIAAGVFLSVSGIAGLRSQARRKKMFESAYLRRDEILNVMMAAKREGKNPIRCLNDQGIHDAELRTWFIETMNDRLKPPARERKTEK